MPKKRLAIVSTHPIQYTAPWFRMLAQSDVVQLKVFYTWEQAKQGPKFDPGFGKTFEWDIPLLDGYDHTFVKNIAAEPGLDHFRGIMNPTLIEEIVAWQADSVLVFGWNFHSHLRCIRHFHKKIPVLFRGESTLLNENPGLRKIARRLFLKWVYSHIDHAFYIGTNNKAYFRKHGLKEEELVFAPYAADNERFGSNDEELEAEAKQWRRELNIKDSDLVLMYAGKFEAVKNLSLLLEMRTALPAEGIKIVYAGSGPLEESLRQESADDPRVIFLGFQNQSRMPLLYRLGDVLILPSNSETWGLVINEAMACERVVIASDRVGCAADLVKEGVNGIVFPHGTSDKCVAFLKALMADRQKVRSMGKASREIVKDFSFSHIVSAIEKLVPTI